MVKQLPCIPTGCSACCRETTMPVTEAEAKRLSRRTGMALEAFTWENNGVLTLLNDEKTRACVFLLTASADVHAEGICSVYEVRPEGCRKYPIVPCPSCPSIVCRVRKGTSGYPWSRK